MFNLDSRVVSYFNGTHVVRISKRNKTLFIESTMDFDKDGYAKPDANWDSWEPCGDWDTDTTILLEIVEGML